MFRAPDVYGYFTSSFTPVKRFTATLTGTYTGSMLVQHFAGYIEKDAETKTRDFFDMNIKLASMLTEYAIDVFRDIDGTDEEDIYLDEFADEIDMWIIDALKNIGCYTAKNVLNMDRNEIIERADLEEQTVDEVLSILAAEFEEDE